jgi:hypothetical protein
MSYLRFLYRQYPHRIRRWTIHWVWFFTSGIRNRIPPKNLLEWFLDLFFYTWDVLCVPEIYMAVQQVLKCETRKLTDEEDFIAREMFGPSLNTDVIRVDSHALLGTRRLAVAYVSFNLINYRYDIPYHIFVHELMHIWQFQNLGSIYIGRAIQAQLSFEKYDYGGPENLLRHMIQGKNILDFNFEQQAEIMEDFFKLMDQTSGHRSFDLTVYEYYRQNLWA